MEAEGLLRTETEAIGKRIRENTIFLLLGKTSWRIRQSEFIAFIKTEHHIKYLLSRKSRLTADHIDYIIKDVHYRGIIVDGLKDEIIGITSAVQLKTEMQSGKRFIDAYHHVLKSFDTPEDLAKYKTQTFQPHQN